MRYFVLRCHLAAPLVELLQYHLSELGFDSFLETAPDSFETSIEETNYQAETLEELLSHFAQQFPDSQLKTESAWEEKQNWNALWESNFEPIIVEDKCLVYADFHHIEKKYPYTLLINPKMSFGTGHHQTTYLLLQFLLELPLQTDKIGLDAGCGTGILGFMALKRGARKVYGCDIEDWSVENALENAALNGIGAESFEAKVGTSALFETQLAQPAFDFILANINRHVLLEEMPLYARLLKKAGTLLLSGFYQEDVAILQQKAQEEGLNLVAVQYRANEQGEKWAALHLQKAQ
ncbi:50S ribosomal protein L11 methyltransferase [Hugenholtzia roseola]|uniref:50S ribosomal protein L11 methyltransferase n=1 Tax=Hugenholtzia roseola TaxID=1002 RepID=UPI00040DA2A9|nr:50S ribosomal protein L11 methyltransferase [Hugenholtzia roseola]